MVRLLSGLAYLALATQTITAASLPESSPNNALNILPDHAPRSADIVSPDHTLERRKGGGGRGGGSGSSSSGSSSSGSSSGGRTSGGSSGGSTRGGSGASRSYGGGGYYGGGAAVPYRSGSRTPKGLVAGALIAPIAVLAIMPGLWLYSVYPYYYTNRYNFYNRTGNRTRINNNGRRDYVGLMIRQESGGANESLPVMCLCSENSVCGCDENDDQQYINDLVGDGDYAKLNKSLVTVSDVNGTRTLVLNGSLPEGTTAPGGQDAAAAALSFGKYAGYWALGLVVLYGTFM